MKSPQLCLLAACLLVSAADALERHKRLTTFGKAPEPQKHPGKPKECHYDKDCPIEHTGCRQDNDGKKRCICDNRKYPVKGICEHVRQKRGYVPKGNAKPNQKEGCCVTLFKPATAPFFPETTTPKRPLFIPAKVSAIALREPCQSSVECIPNAECKLNPNATTQAEKRTKVCLCRVDTVEEDGECNGCSHLQISSWVLLTLGLSSLMAFNH